jgi:hypothetical protein
MASADRAYYGDMRKLFPIPTNRVERGRVAPQLGNVDRLTLTGSLRDILQCQNHRHLRIVAKRVTVAHARLADVLDPVFKGGLIASLRLVDVKRAVDAEGRAGTPDRDLPLASQPVDKVTLAMPSWSPSGDHKENSSSDWSHLAAACQRPQTSCIAQRARATHQSW